VYESLPCWQQPARGARAWEELPNEARAYAERVQTLVGVPVGFAGTGPGRLALARRGS
jgi:adenylosuccinate synthase